MTIETKKRGRPKGSKGKKSYAFSFNGALMGMKQGDILYTRQKPKDITSRMTRLGLSGQFRTEKVVVIHLQSGESETGALVTKR